MSNSKNWIPWDERDLEDKYLVTRCLVVHVGRIPKEYEIEFVNTLILAVDSLLEIKQAERDFEYNDIDIYKLILKRFEVRQKNSCNRFFDWAYENDCAVCDLDENDFNEIYKLCCNSYSPDTFDRLDSCKLVTDVELTSSERKKFINNPVPFKEFEFCLNLVKGKLQAEDKEKFERMMELISDFQQANMTQETSPVPPEAQKRITESSTNDTEKISNDEITNDKPADYTSIIDHLKRRQKMYNDGMTPSEISSWEKNQDNRKAINAHGKPCPSSGVDAIKKSLQRADVTTKDNGETKKGQGKDKRGQGKDKTENKTETN